MKIALLALTLVSSAAFAQDFTPPAGGWRGIDSRPNQGEGQTLCSTHFKKYATAARTCGAYQLDVTKTYSGYVCDCSHFGDGSTVQHH